MKSSIKLLCTVAAFFISSNLSAQVCSGALGDPVVGAGTDFGTGTGTYGTPLPTAVISYTYVAGTPNDGQYTIVKSTSGLNSGWHQNIVNHTPNSPNGYMLLVNADYNQGVFYQTTVNQLCPNNTYEFAAWIINILRNPGIKPNVKFTIQNTYQNVTTVLKEFSTGDIPEGSSTDWKQYGTIFTTPTNLGVITLKMTNVNPGGSGNDLAIDDITFRPCGPMITPSVTNANNFFNNIANICAGDTKILTLSAQVSAGYNAPQFQWQELNGTVWTNSIKPGAQTQNLTVSFINAQTGNYTFRLLAAETGNLNSANCRVVSPEILIKVNELPIAVASNSGMACIGSNVNLNVSNGTSFIWKDPTGNIFSTAQNPVISNITQAQAGIYSIIVTNASGCQSAVATTEVRVYAPVVASTNISTATFCENGEPIQLEAYGGTNYSWSPSVGLSNPNIANPKASPKQTTTYNVTVTNGTCAGTVVPVTIIVLKKPMANAGDDQKIIAGRTVELNGKALGDHTTFVWSPSDYLDDPTKLNPTASPPQDITYTLTVQSECGVDTDQIFIKVYPKIEIPNTFTPNGDQINDTWVIPAISSFQNSKLRIYTRNGQLVYEGSKNSPPWDGKFKGKDLPVAVYYYILFLDNDMPTYTGWVMIAR